MSNVAIVTDSSACLPAATSGPLGIRVLPITVHLPGSDHLDGGDGLPQLVYQALDRNQPVKSSEPSMADYLDAIEEAGPGPVVVVTPAVEFTAMFGHATSACDLAGHRAVAVDSRTAAAGQGLVVRAGARVAAGGGSLDRVLRALDLASGRVDLVASLATLVPLRRSGRVPSASLVQPGRGRDARRTLFRMREGAVEPLASVRSPEAAVEAIGAEWESGGRPGADSCMVFHADCPALADQLGRRLGGVTSISEFSAAMGIHTGRGVVGAAWTSSPS